ncbi:MAG: hypothetical protein RLZZ617_343 [Bacteroidota bacterium]
MSIRNKVQESGLLIVDPSTWLFPEKQVVGLDLALLMDEFAVLREKLFREKVQALNPVDFRGKVVALYCSVDAIWPPWAVMLLTARLQEGDPNAGPTSVHYGTPEGVRLQLSIGSIQAMDTGPYLNGRVMIKACSKADWAPAMYQALSSRLLPVVQSLWYGEPCSAVPVYKRQGRTS